MPGIIYSSIHDNDAVYTCNLTYLINLTCPLGVLMFQRAEINEAIIGSVSYTRARKRINFFVQIDYDDQPYVAKIHHWIKVPHPESSLIEPLRLPIVTFYETEAVPPFDFRARATLLANAAVSANAAATAAVDTRSKGIREKEARKAEAIATQAENAAQLALAVGLTSPAPVTARTARAPRARGPALAATLGTRHTRLLKIDSNVPVIGEEYYAADPDTIANLMIVFFPGGSEREGVMYCTSYSHLTSR